MEDWERLTFQHKRNVDALYESYIESLRTVIKDKRNTNGNESSLRNWNPVFHSTLPDVIGSPPEGEYSSNEMDKIRKLQKIIRQRVIQRKWNRLGSLKE